MTIYDISQEVFTCCVFSHDPSPERIRLSRIPEGGSCNLTAFQMCAHNGTHVDAPYHFYEEGKTIDQVDLDRFIGPAFVTAFEGELTTEDAEAVLKKAKECDPACAGRILLKGNAVVTEEAAQVFAEEGIRLIGNESQTVGPEAAPRNVHLILLGAEVVLLEGIRLQEVPEGRYLLHAAPLNLGGADGAPCRATLIEI